MNRKLSKYVAECLGTAVLVFFGCGSAVFIDKIGVTGVAVAFGLTIIAMAYSIGNISGCHINPAVSLAMLITKKMNLKDFCWYVVAQVIGAFIGALILMVIVNNIGRAGSLGENGFNFPVYLAFLIEIILTFVFVFTILGVTSDESKSNIAGIIIALTLTLVHILGINLTGTSVNPARSLAPAVLLGGKALEQIWVFILAPAIGSIFAALTHIYLNKR